MFPLLQPWTVTLSNSTDRRASWNMRAIGRKKPFRSRTNCAERLWRSQLNRNRTMTNEKLDVFVVQAQDRAGPLDRGYARARRPHQSLLALTKHLQADRQAG